MGLASGADISESEGGPQSKEPGQGSPEVLGSLVRTSPSSPGSQVPSFLLPSLALLRAVCMVFSLITPRLTSMTQAAQEPPQSLKGKRSGREWPTGGLLWEENETMGDRMGARNEPEEGGHGGDRTGSREVRKRGVYSETSNLHG